VLLDREKTFKQIANGQLVTGWPRLASGVQMLQVKFESPHGSSQGPK